MASVKTLPNLTSGRLLARSTLWNLLGQILPGIVGLFAIPPLVHGLGVDRFGLLSLAWILIGYFSLFDLGLGRAVTKLIADKLGANETAAIPPLAWTSLVLMLVLGVAGGIFILVIGPPAAYRLLKISPELQQETLHSILLLATAVPAVTVTSGLRGILEAQQQFRILNLIRIPMGVYFFLGPLLALPFSHTITAAIGVLVVGRFVGGAVHVIACFHAMPALKANFVFQRSLMSPLLSFGGWMTVSGILSPFMVYVDRFLIGMFLSLSAVTYYSAPSDVIIRLWIVPWSVAGVLFPALAMSLSQDQARAGLLLARGTKYTFLAIFPVILGIVGFAPEALRFWLGPVFAQNSSSVMRLIAAGVLVNCVGHMAFTLIQSAGRPDITAKLHLIELPTYSVTLFILVKLYGLEGAAAAFLLRLAADAIISFFFAYKLLPEPSGFPLKLAGAMLAGLALLCAAAWSHSIALRLAIFLGGNLLLAVIGYRTLAPEERNFILGRWRGEERSFHPVPALRDPGD